MRRLSRYSTALIFLIVPAAVAGQTVISMPPPPSPSQHVTPEAGSGAVPADAETPSAEPGDYALGRYAWGRVYPSYSYYAPGYRGYGYYGGHYHRYGYGYGVYSYFYPFFSVHHGVMLGDRPFFFTSFGDVTIHR